jgi:hypothetical protein
MHQSARNICECVTCLMKCKMHTDGRPLQEKVSDSSSKPSVHMAGRPSVPPYPLPVLPMDDDEISSKCKSY